jgi:universal stress protein E
MGSDLRDYLKPQTHLVKGWARKEIPIMAKRLEADLVVMGTVARTGIPGFAMGNTAETILSQLDCSVLAIKPPGFATRVTLEN